MMKVIIRDFTACTAGIISVVQIYQTNLSISLANSCKQKAFSIPNIT